VGYPIGNRSGFAGPSTCVDYDWASQALCGSTLLVVQVV
jgi:hypothetical protein